jgi:hydroxyethylthiazole kinase-like uncharacterized protein yjeF
MKFLSVLSSSQSLKLDNKAINYFGISSEVLVESAGRTCAQILISERILTTDDEILILVGSGNNGADGLVISKVLHSLGYKVTIYETKLSENLLSISLKNQLALLGVNFIDLNLGSISSFSLKELIEKYAKVIDCVTGTGFKGQISEKFEKLICCINQSKIEKKILTISIDIPSFNDCDEPINKGFESSYTLAIQTLKKIHVDPEQLDKVGQVFLLDVGIPMQEEFLNTQVTSKLKVSSCLSDCYEESRLINKGNRPSVLVIGGSRGKEGAAILSAVAALKTGASIVKVASFSSEIINIMPPEVMYEFIDKNYNLEQSIKNSDSVVLGPGLGLEKESSNLFFKVVELCCFLDKPLLVDADGIKILGDMFLGTSISLPRNLVLTPHPKEFMSLMKVDSIKHVLKERFELTQACSNKYNATVILKGPRSLISNGKLININPHIESILAVGGSGDVLSGIIACLLARIDDPFVASFLGVYLHGAAGSELSKKYQSNFGALATEIADQIPYLITKYKSFNKLNYYEKPFECEMDF